jgi:hypothetical protein
LGNRLDTVEMHRHHTFEYGSTSGAAFASWHSESKSDISEYDIEEGQDANREEGDFTRVKHALRRPIVMLPIHLMRLGTLWEGKNG